MKKIAVLLCALLVIFAVHPCPALAQSAAAYVIMDSDSGHVFDAVNGDKKLQIASLTKIATAMVVLDWLDSTKKEPNELATVPESAAQLTDPNPLDLKPGDRLSIRDLLYAALMQSDNISAVTLAEHVGRNFQAGGKTSAVDAFVAQMNALARKLHLGNTLFLNPHGLETERKPPYSTALDLAHLTQYAMARSTFRFYVSQKERRIAIQRAGGTATNYLLRNTNELLDSNGIDGVKTGTTKRAGECLILSSARAPESIQQGEKYVVTPRRLIVVMLGAQERFRTGAQLLTRGWEMHDRWVAAGRPAR